MKKMLYMGHSYHLKTKSNRFLFELLEQEYEISFVSYDPYSDKYVGIEETKGEKYDVLLLWQIMPEMSFLVTNFSFGQGVLFPMYDYIISRESDPWPEYRGFKIINFCRTSHEELISRGYNSYYIQYFPQPKDSIEPGDESSVFFWQRMENIDIDVVTELLKNQGIKHIHIHKSMDPGQEFTMPDEELEKIITYSDWFDSPADMHNIMARSAYYIAPRLYEGIGMSFLEAMAMGRCVIAPNTPTMNEYITDGINGILYDLDDVKPIRLENVRDVQKNAKAYIEEGYKGWEKNKKEILKWIAEESEQPLVTVVTVVKDALKGGRGEMLAQCIESVHNQHYPNIEHLLMDGASEDGTLNLIAEYEKLGWVECCSEPDSGMYEAMNKGIRRAKGKYIVFLNTDDYFHNVNAIKESVFSLENSQADFSFAANRILMENGVCDTIRKPQIGSYVAQMPFCHQTMFTKKSALVEVGLFNENYKSSADYDLVIRLLLGGYRYVEVETDIVTYRNGGVSESMQLRSDQEKYEIFKTLYAPYYDKVSDKFAKELAGRTCPMQLLSNLKKEMSDSLNEAIDAAVLDIDENEQAAHFPEEIMVPITAEVCDEISYRANAKNLDLQKNLAREQQRNNKLEREFGLLDRWLWIKLDYRNIKIYFEQRDYKSIAIYGVGEIANRFYEEISRTSEIEIKYAIGAESNLSHPFLKVYAESDEMPLVDAIVVCDISIVSAVKNRLKEKVNCPIVSIEDVIYKVPDEREGALYGVVGELVAELERERTQNTQLLNELEREKEESQIRLKIMEESGKQAAEYGQYYRLFDRWLWLKLAQKGIQNYFDKQGYRTLAVYGVGEICNRFYEEISQIPGIEIKYILEKEPGNEHPVLPVYCLQDEVPEVDAVVVSLDYIYEDIKTVLVGKFDCPIISIDDVIYNS